MKFSKYLTVLATLAFMQISFASSRDTMELIPNNPYFPDYTLGWFGEAWCDSLQRWYGDTLYKDTTIDSIVKYDTFTVNKIKPDTLYKGTDSQKVVDTTVLDTVITKTVTTIDSTQILLDALYSVFKTDTGGVVPGAKYTNYYYKFRDYWAQCPIIWNNWQGYDFTPFKQLLVVYKGPLPTHIVKVDFFYAAWGGYFDSLKNKNKSGDGVGMLTPSTNWATKIIDIPDSCDRVGVTGVVFNLSNGPSATVGTSAVGNFRIGRLAFIGSTVGAKNTVPSHGVRTDRFRFIPKTAGEVKISIFALNGELLYSSSMGVEANKVYSVRELAKRYSGDVASQVRLLTIKGAGIEIKQRIW